MRDDILKKWYYMIYHIWYSCSDIWSVKKCSKGGNTKDEKL